MTELCKECADALEGPLSTPTHLVHPEHGAHMVFDIFGVAVCPSFRATWFRDRKGAVLLNGRKPAKRATAVAVKERKSPKRVTSGKRGHGKTT